MRNIQVRIKSVYGNQHIYPVCETARLFASMVGRKTLTSADISCIKALGYTVEVVQDKITL